MFKASTAELAFVLKHTAGIFEQPDACADLTDDAIEAILDGAAKLAVEKWAPLRREGDVTGARLAQDGVVMPPGYRAAYREFVDGGWGAISSPYHLGGNEMPMSVRAAVLELLGTANLSLALCPILTAGAVEVLLNHGSEAQKKRYLPHLATSNWCGTMNLTEPQAGTDVGALRTQAYPGDGGNWRIRGTKIFISFGDHDLADNIIHLVLARTPGSPPGTKGISLFLVPKYRLDADGNPGELNDIKVVSIEHKLGLHASPTCVLSFGDEDACVGELIGEENRGMRAMFTMMNNARLNVGLQGVQAAELATQLASVYAGQRVQSARAGAPTSDPVPIIRHPDVRRMLMRMRAQSQAIRALVYYAFGQADRAIKGDARAQGRLALLTPLAKSHATDVALEVASLSIRVHGGVGYVEETGVAQILRDASILPIYEGTNGIQAADLVLRKLDSGALVQLLNEIADGAIDLNLRTLAAECAAIAEKLRQESVDDRLAASSPFLTMLAVVVSGWLLERQNTALILKKEHRDRFATAKIATTNFYLKQVLPEAFGLKSAARSAAADLFELSDDALIEFT